jgi:hypothetical protein
MHSGRGRKEPTRDNRFLLRDRGIDARPLQVVFMQIPNKLNSWMVRHGTCVAIPRETAAGSTVDRDDYILSVDDVSGVVTVLA